MRETSKSILNITALLTYLPAFFYLCAFAYEAGNCEAYNIPRYLIEVGLTNVLQFAGIIFLIASGIGSFFLNFVFAFNTVKFNLKRKFTVWMLTFNGIMLVVFFLANQTITAKQFAIKLAILLLGNLLLLTSSYYIKKSHSNLLKDIDSLEERRNVLEQTMFFRYLGDARLIGTAFLMVFSCFFSYLIGYKSAMLQDDYSVIKETHELVVLKKYGDYIVCRPLKNKIIQLKDSLFVLKLDEKHTQMMYNSNSAKLIIADKE